MSARPGGAGRPGTAGRKGMAVTEDDRRRAAMEVLERQILSIGRDVATLSADTLERLGAMLDVHAAELRAARLGSLDMRTLAARSTAAVAGHLGTHACALCLKRFGALLPISDDEIGRAHV